MRQMITMIIQDSYFQRVVLIGTGFVPRTVKGNLRKCPERGESYSRLNLANIWTEY